MQEHGCRSRGRLHTHFFHRCHHRRKAIETVHVQPQCFVTCLVDSTATAGMPMCWRRYGGSVAPSTARRTISPIAAIIDARNQLHVSLSCWWAKCKGGRAFSSKTLEDVPAINTTMSAARIVALWPYGFLRGTGRRPFGARSVAHGETRACRRARETRLQPTFFDTLVANAAVEEAVEAVPVGQNRAPHHGELACFSSPPPPAKACRDRYSE